MVKINIEMQKIDPNESKDDKSMRHWRINYIIWKYVCPLFFLMYTVMNYDGAQYKKILIYIGLSYGLIKYWQICDIFEDHYDNQKEDS